MILRIIYCNTQHMYSTNTTTRLRITKPYKNTNYNTNNTKNSMAVSRCQQVARMDLASQPEVLAARSCENYGY